MSTLRERIEKVCDTVMEAESLEGILILTFDGNGKAEFYSHATTEVLEATPDTLRTVADAMDEEGLPEEEADVFYAKCPTKRLQ